MNATTLRALALCCLAAPAVAAPPGDLPPVESALQALERRPAVAAARAELLGAAAERDILVAGDQEIQLRLAAQRRDVSGGPGHGEWQAGLERGIRLPGKARLDAGIGHALVEEMTERTAEARHETARELLELWYGARQARAEAELWRRQVEGLEEMRRIVDTRRKRGDAARLELLQADAALARARSQSVAASAREDAALARLQAGFPELPPPDAARARPTPPQGDADFWLERGMENNHELLALQRALERARLVARRAEAERTPDPALGFYLAGEQGGRERIAGLSLALALPGEARRLQPRRRLAEAQALAEREAESRRRVSAELASNWRSALAGVETWRRLDEAAGAMESHADLARRAHELGELGLADALQAGAQAREARLAAEQGRLEANQAHARLLLDAHQLWPLSHASEGDHK